MSLVRARRGCRMRMKETKNNGCSCSLEVGSFLMERLGNISPPGSDWQGGEGGGGRVPDLVIRGTEQTPEDDNQRQGAPLRSIQGNYCDNPSQLRLVIVQTPPDTLAPSPPPPPTYQDKYLPTSQPLQNLSHFKKIFFVCFPTAFVGQTGVCPRSTQ